MKVTDPPIVVTNLYDASIHEVWDALTHVEQMRQWYFDNIDAFKPIVGSKSSFIVRSEDRTFTHTWEVTKAEAPNIISYNWTYPEYPGDGYVTFALEQKGDQTQLTLTMIVTEDYPNDIPEFKRQSCIGGWDYFLGLRLKEYLQKQ